MSNTIRLIIKSATPLNVIIFKSNHSLIGLITHKCPPTTHHSNTTAKNLFILPQISKYPGWARANLSDIFCPNRSLARSGGVNLRNILSLTSSTGSTMPLLIDGRKIPWEANADVGKGWLNDQNKICIELEVLSLCYFRTPI